MVHRVLSLLRARLGAGPRGGLPVAALLGHGLVGTLLCALVADQLAPWPYALFVVSLVAVLLAIPLLGELGGLLRADEAEEWVAALPVRAAELRIARTIHLAILLWSLALAVLLPAIVLAPAEAAVGARLVLVPAGLGMATLFAALLLAVQALLGGRAEGLLVLFQTALVCATLAGLVLGIGAVPALVELGEPGRAAPAWFAFFPPAWFEAPLAEEGSLLARGALPAAVFVLSLAALALIPAPAAPRGGRREPPLTVLLAPVRALGTRLWVRRAERGMFDLVYDALPREREFVLRTYPMLGIPIAFLAVSASGEGSGAGRADLLALLLFSAGIYLPVLLTQVPGSASHAARWLHESAPVAEEAIVGGTIKAIALRFLVPLYVALFVIAAALGHLGLALRLTLPGALTSLLVLRLTYPVCVSDRPLSVAPDRLRTDLDWFGTLAVIGVALALVAILAQRFVTSLPAVLGLLVVLVAVEAAVGSSRARRAPREPAGEDRGG